MSIEIVVAIAIGIFILIILMFITKGSISNLIRGIESCEAKYGGACYPTSCGDLESIPAGDKGCRSEFKDDKYVCCKSQASEPGGGAKGEGANYQLFTALVNKNNVKYGNTVELEIEKLYKIEMSIDSSKLPIAGSPNKYCSFFLKDYVSGNNYVLSNEENGFSGGGVYIKPMSEEDSYGKDSTVFKCPTLSDSNKIKLTGYFKPTELDASRNYVVTFIVYDKDVAEKMPSAETNTLPEEPSNLIHEMTHWAAHFAFQLRVKPIVEITDISGIWVAYDDITVRAFAPYKLSKVEIAIVNQANINDAIRSGKVSDNIYAQVYAACSNPTTQYKSAVNKITAISSGKQGTNLGLFSLGKEAYQTARYISQPQPISINSETNTAKFRLDASSLSVNFPTEAKNLLDEALITDQNKDALNHYLCAKVGVISSDKRVAAKQIIAFSINPLKLDVAPPMIDNTDEYIQVHYPDYNLVDNTLQKLIQDGKILPGQSLTRYYFDHYPTIAIKKCIDKSGCKNYDYYFAPTQIRVNINANDLQTGILATVLSAGLNYLYQEIVTRNPLDTLCPLANSGQYRVNTYPEIRFSRREEQGVFCIRVSDAVGNYWLTWKVAYEPYDVLEDLAANATKAVIGGGGITPVIGSN
jgi:hypothetical protein